MFGIHTKCCKNPDKVIVDKHVFPSIWESCIANGVRPSLLFDNYFESEVVFHYKCKNCNDLTMKSVRYKQ